MRFAARRLILGDMSPMQLPKGARLVHIGPHKTGSTALQSALHQARTELDEQGVRYASVGRHDARPIRWVTNRMVAGVNVEAQPPKWERVRRRLTPPAGGRAVFSSEFFSDATDQQIERIARDMDVDNTWIAVTLRPLAKILPSQYQQYLQRGSSFTYATWLKSKFGDNPSPKLAPQFWVRHRHDELVARWAAHFGSDKMIVIALDSADHGFLPRTFEQLLGLTSGTLESKPAIENRSLTTVEAEVLRQFNTRYRADGQGPAWYAKLMGSASAVLKERTPSRLESKLITPDWAVESANAIAAEMMTNIARSGVTVYGDLDAMSKVPLTGAIDTGPEVTEVDLELATQFGWSFACAAAKLADGKHGLSGPPS